MRERVGKGLKYEYKLKLKNMKQPKLWCNSVILQSFEEKVFPLRVEISQSNSLAIFFDLDCKKLRRIIISCRTIY